MVREDSLDRRSGVRCVLLLPTLKQAKDLYAQDLANDLEGNGRWSFLGAEINRSSWLIRFPGGSSIQLLGAASASGKRGFRCDLVACDEGDDITIPFYDAVVSPWFTEPWSKRIRIVAGTPKMGRLGLLYRTHARGSDGPDGRRLEVRRDNGEPFPRHFSLHATGYDTPETVDPASLAEERAGMDPERFEREYLCNFDAAEGLVYPRFSSFHVREPDPRVVWNDVIVGVDWGFRDPEVMLVIGIAGKGHDVTAHVIDEVYTTGLTDTELARLAGKIAARYPKARWYADPSRPQTIESFRTELGINIVGADNAIEDGIATVADMLLVRDRGTDDDYPDEWAQLYVAPHCTNTIREFGLYKHKRDRQNTDRITETIAPGNDHAMDALRYALFSHFGGPDSRIATGYGCR